MVKDSPSERLLAESMLSGARSRLVTICYFALVAMGFLVMPFLIMRIQSIGWNLSAYIHFTVVPVGTVLAFFFGKFSLRTRSILLIFFALMSSFGGLFTYGIIGSGFYGMAMMAVVVAAITMGQITAFSTLFISVAVFISLMFMVLSGRYELAPNLDRYAMSATGWIVSLSGLILYSLMLIVGIQAMHTLLKELIYVKIRNSRVIEDTNIFLESVFNSTQAMLITLDSDLKIDRFNRACLEVTGHKAADFMESRFIELLIPEVRREDYRRYFLEDNYPMSGEDDWLTGDGRELRVMWNINAVKHPGNEPDHWIISAMDVTSERQLQKELQQAEKLRSIGRLAGGVAHDFNNMLAAIVGSAEMISHTYRDRESAPYITTIKNTCQKAADLTRQLLSFSRLEKGPFEILDVNTAVMDAVNLVSVGLPGSIKVNAELYHEPLLVKGESSHIVNAILNLAINARDAIPGKGTITIGTSIKQIDEKLSLGMLSELEPGHYAEIIVSDNGIGIARQDLENIFDPFFTTKEKGRGTGLGLASVYGTVQNHGGAIRVYSETEVGTVFRIYLPCMEEGAEGMKVAPAITSGCRSASILLIEDDDSIRKNMADILEHFGHRVVSASNGSEGLEILGSGGRDAFDLVILDWIMPVMGGRDTFKIIREKHGDIPVIISSGFAPEHESLNLNVDNRLLFFLHKPYNSETLLSAIIKICNVAH